MKTWAMALTAAAGMLAATVALPLAAQPEASQTRVGMILEQQQGIRDQMDRSNGTYARLDRAAKERIREQQDELFVLLDGVVSIDELAPPKQVAVFNALEVIKRVITDNRESHQQCWRERRTGSSLPMTRCATVGERERLMNDAQAWKSDVGACIPQGAGTVSCGRMGE